MRGRCSVITNSPPVKSSPGSSSRIGDLQRKDVLAVEVPVQAIVVVRAVLSSKGVGRLGRPGGSAPGRTHGRPGNGRLAHPLMPAVGDRRQVRVGRVRSDLDERRQRIAEVFVLAPAEAVARHHHAAAEALVLLVEAASASASAWLSSFGMIVQPCASRSADTRGQSTASSRSSMFVWLTAIFPGSALQIRRWRRRRRIARANRTWR